MSTQSPPSMAPSSATSSQPSTWHSPVPYLFGGLAAMLGLIAFALLVLACSYWKLSGYQHNNQEEDTDLDIESGDVGEIKSDNNHGKSPAVFEEKYLVILAGEVKPTCLATQVSSGESSFGSCSCRSDLTEKLSTSEMEDDGDDLHV